MFHHIIKFYLHRRNALKVLKRQRLTWSFTQNDGIICGYVAAERVFGLIGIHAANDSRIRAWAGTL